MGYPTCLTFIKLKDKLKLPASVLWKTIVFPAFPAFFLQKWPFFQLFQPMWPPLTHNTHHTGFAIKKGIHWSLHEMEFIHPKEISKSCISLILSWIVFRVASTKFSVFSRVSRVKISWNSRVSRVKTVEISGFQGFVRQSDKQIHKTTN